MLLRTELRLSEPILGEFLYAVGHIPAAENSERKHLLGSKFWREVGSKMCTLRLCEDIGIASLHLVVHGNFRVPHRL